MMRSTARKIAHTKDVDAAPFLVAPLLVLALAQIGVVGDNAGLSIAIKPVMEALGATMGDMQMANMMYSLVGGSFMIAGGMLGINIGWRKTLRIGLALAVVGEICIVFAPNIDVLIWGGRVLVGLGASFITPSVLGSIPALYHGRNRVLAFGFIAAASGLSTLVPIPFGLLLDSFGFRVAFGVVAIFLLLTLVGTVFLPKQLGVATAMKFDFKGMSLAASGLSLLLIGLSRMPSWGVLEPLPGCPVVVLGLSPSLFLVGAGIVVLVVLVFAEKRIEATHGYAILPRSFIANPAVRAGLLAIAVPYFFMGSQGILMTPYMQLVAGLSATQTGFLALLSGVPMLLCSMFVPRLMPHASPKRVIQSGYCLIVAAIVLMITSLQPHGVTVAMFVGVFVSGIGTGVVNSQSNNAVASAVDARDAQQSGGIQGTARNIGLAFGAALMGTVLLLSVPLTLSEGLAASTTISQEACETVQQAGVSFMGDDAFAGVVSSVSASPSESAELVEINAYARRDASRISLGVLAGLIALCLLGTRNLIDRNTGPEKAAVPVKETS